MSTGGAAAAAVTFSVTGEVPKDIECVVCLDAWTDPVEFGCGHVTCGPCSGPLRNCPTCRVPITTRGTPHRILLSIVNNLAVKCDACGWTGRRDQQHSHLAEKHGAAAARPPPPPRPSAASTTAPAPAPYVPTAAPPPPVPVQQPPPPQQHMARPWFNAPQMPYGAPPPPPGPYGAQQYVPAAPAPMPNGWGAPPPGAMPQPAPQNNPWALHSGGGSAGAWGSTPSSAPALWGVPAAAQQPYAMPRS